MHRLHPTEAQKNLIQMYESKSVHNALRLKKEADRSKRQTDPRLHKVLFIEDWWNIVYLGRQPDKHMDIFQSRR